MRRRFPNFLPLNKARFVVPSFLLLRSYFFLPTDRRDAESNAASAISGCNAELEHPRSRDRQGRHHPRLMMSSLRSTSQCFVSQWHCGVQPQAHKHMQTQTHTHTRGHAHAPVCDILRLSLRFRHCRCQHELLFPVCVFVYLSQTGGGEAR